MLKEKQWLYNELQQENKGFLLQCLKMTKQNFCTDLDSENQTDLAMPLCAMSMRNCAPGKLIWRQAWVARAAAAGRLLHCVVTAITRPPAVTKPSLVPAVPQWNTTVSGHFKTASIPVAESPQVHKPSQNNYNIQLICWSKFPKHQTYWRKFITI